MRFMPTTSANRRSTHRPAPLPAHLSSPLTPTAIGCRLLRWNGFQQLRWNAFQSGSVGLDLGRAGQRVACLDWQARVGEFRDVPNREPVNS